MKQGIPISRSHIMACLQGQMHEREVTIFTEAETSPFWDGIIFVSQTAKKM